MRLRAPRPPSRHRPRRTVRARRQDPAREPADPVPPEPSGEGRGVRGRRGRRRRHPALAEQVGRRAEDEDRHADPDGRRVGRHPVLTSRLQRLIRANRPSLATSRFAIVLAASPFAVHPPAARPPEWKAAMRRSSASLAAATLLTLGLVVGAAAPAEAAVPRSYRNALAQAKSYVRVLDISKAGLYDQLHSRYGGRFSAKAARYGANHVKANWNREALGAAKSYVRVLDISKAGLHDQLVSKHGSQFTEKQAKYALRHVKVNYNKEALAAAKSYDRLFHMSDAELYDQLTSKYGAQFTASQANYAIDHL
ncbi:hypothetical protein D1781_10020 [Amnibacterium setariae]|uniref:Putative host cell surface-exposed lipoprotein Ltp-like HTH region domain-containing protein n=1 Tax=Amnibacterium setariae TaxID=2306585 RepID=A0A3A1TVL8_9MICO|nr:hypothetical protein D1781_10020 [Amnibacterium setariae]